MKGKKLIRIGSFVLVATMLTASFAACGENTGKKTETPLVVGYSAFSQKFSPFFADTAYDQDVANMTQVSLMTMDRKGDIVYNSIEGETREYNGNKYTYKGISDLKETYDKDANITTYDIKIRDDVKFSDGTKLTADDIIFSYYVLADKTYTGSLTLSSTAIVGMKNYRFNTDKADTISEQAVKDAIAKPSDEYKAMIKEQIIKPTLTGEQEWAKTEDALATLKDEKTKPLMDATGLTKEQIAVLAFYGQKKAADYAFLKGKTDADVLNALFEEYGTDYQALAAAYAGKKTYFDQQVFDMIEADMIKKAAANGSKEVVNIAGIKKISDTEVEVQATGYDAAAIYQICGISVAPMHYYGDKALYDYANNKFGFTRGDLKAVSSKTAKPMGAGAYKFVKYENKVVYFEANASYYQGAPKTKYVQFKETAEADKIAGVGAKKYAVDITDPSGSKQNMNAISGYNSNKKLTGDTVTTFCVDNLGYGDIGINAETVNVGGKASSEESKALRKGLATVLAVYRDVVIDSYYGDAASVINYPISNTSWAAPQKSDADYSVAYSKDASGKDLYTSDMKADDKYAAALKGALSWFEAAGYTVKDGKLVAAPKGAKMEYEIIIPAEGGTDHPAFGILTYAKAALAKIGMTLTINNPSDSNVLWNANDAGTQQLWVAAWGATPDPDMYQVYHSSNVVGKGGTDSNTYHIADPALDKGIMDARASADRAFRKTTYKACLDTILDWGVEIPTYQRQNTFIFSTKRVKISSVVKDPTPFYTWLAEIDKIEMN